MQGTAAVTRSWNGASQYSSTLSAAPVTFARLLSQIPSAWIPTQPRAQCGGPYADGLITVQSMSLSGEMAPVRGRTSAVWSKSETAGSRLIRSIPP